MGDRSESSDALREAALIYVRRGWPVLPLHSPEGRGCSCRRSTCHNVGKHPRTEHGLKDATIDEATIFGWWRRWPGANVGIVTGMASGLLVLDIDPRHGGVESLALLEREHGSLPETAEVSTGGGGRHILFLHPGFRVKNRANMMPGVDVRGDDGYIVAPPSLHASGRRYEWRRLWE